LRTPRNFIFTSHSQKRARERRITKDQFEQAVAQADTRRKQYRGALGGIVYLFSKKIGGRTLTVVAELHKENCYFVTGYWS
jgi:hypothetical protein